jgi:hypothetical protein
MINTAASAEKMALFWHGVFATGWHKSEHTPSMALQIDMFRRNGLSDIKTILLNLSRDPAMLDWLDNSENHKMLQTRTTGVSCSNSSRWVWEVFEADIKMAARLHRLDVCAAIPLYPYGFYPTHLLPSDDHDESVKTFLGKTGRFNGEDIVEAIVKKPATAKFIAATSTTSLWPTSRRSRPGTRCHHRIRRRSTSSGVFRFRRRSPRHVTRAVSRSLLPRGALSQVKSPAELVAST